MGCNILTVYMELTQTKEKIIYILEIFLRINFAYVLNLFF
jgi:hypothetical protein